MSRDYKFRIWDSTDERMDYDPDTHWSSPHECLSINDAIADYETIMQFTGLSDKNGKQDAYEADIIQTFYDDGRKGDVGYLECTNLGSLCLIVKGRDIPIPLYFYPSWEILGNLHQHPHLLP